MEKVIYLECFAGISGNMLLGAFLNAGLPETVLRQELKKLSLDGYELLISPVEKHGIHAVYVDVKLEEHHHEHEHDGHHVHHQHRHLPDILALIDESALAPTVKETAKTIFNVLAKAEAKVHGTTMDKIHFHEVGAVDSIVDIVGTAIALDYFHISKIYASRLTVGTGFVKCSHGMMPVPAPATAELLQGMPYIAGDIPKELVTPTGAAVLAAMGASFGDMPARFSGEHIGYGAGTWELDIPNVLRMHLGSLEEKSADAVLVMETNIDDLNPQIYSHVMDKLLAVGALDVWLTPIIMKKGRPATTLSVLFTASLRNMVEQVIFTETTTIGVRCYQTSRTVAQRNIVWVDTQWGKVRVKQSFYKGELCNAYPEYEDCQQLANEQHIPLKLVQLAALAAAKEDRH